jgi:hypothetical protein
MMLQLEEALLPKTFEVFSNLTPEPYNSKKIIEICRVLKIQIKTVKGYKFLKQSFPNNLVTLTEK